MQEVFSEIYEKNLWGGTKGEPYSGPGSRYAPAELYVKTVIEFILTNGISTVLDLGCGDFAIGKKIAAVCSNYIGVDIVPKLIERNTRLFGSDRIRFACLDITNETLPDAQLCLIRRVLQHLSNEEISNVLAKVQKYPHLIITEHYPNNPVCYICYEALGLGSRMALPYSSTNTRSMRPTCNYCLKRLPWHQTNTVNLNYVTIGSFYVPTR